MCRLKTFETFKDFCLSELNPSGQETLPSVVWSSAVRLQLQWKSVVQWVSLLFTPGGKTGKSKDWELLIGHCVCVCVCCSGSRDSIMEVWRNGSLKHRLNLPEQQKGSVSSFSSVLLLPEVFDSVHTAPQCDGQPSLPDVSFELMWLMCECQLFLPVFVPEGGAVECVHRLSRSVYLVHEGSHQALPPGDAARLFWMLLLNQSQKSGQYFFIQRRTTQQEIR